MACVVPGSYSALCSGLAPSEYILRRRKKIPVRISAVGHVAIPASAPPSSATVTNDRVNDGNHFPGKMGGRRGFEHFGLDFCDQRRSILTVVLLPEGGRFGVERIDSHQYLQFGKRRDHFVFCSGMRPPG